MKNRFLSAKDPVSIQVDLINPLPSPTKRMSFHQDPIVDLSRDILGILSDIHDRTRACTMKLTIASNVPLVLQRVTGFLIELTFPTE